MTSPRSGHTIANDLLERLLALSNGDLRNALGVAKEYADHPAIAGAPSMPAGNRLMAQIEFGLKEVAKSAFEHTDYP